jgi:hypothetical protein
LVLLNRLTPVDTRASFLLDVRLVLVLQAVPLVAIRLRGATVDDQGDPDLTGREGRTTEATSAGMDEAPQSARPASIVDPENWTTD